MNRHTRHKLGLFLRRCLLGSFVGIIIGSIYSCPAHAIEPGNYPDAIPNPLDHRFDAVGALVLAEQQNNLSYVNGSVTLVAPGMVLGIRHTVQAAAMVVRFKGYDPIPISGWYFPGFTIGGDSPVVGYLAWPVTTIDPIPLVFDESYCCLGLVGTTIYHAGWGETAAGPGSAGVFRVCENTVTGGSGGWLLSWWPYTNPTNFWQCGPADKDSGSPELLTSGGLTRVVSVTRTIDTGLHLLDWQSDPVIGALGEPFPPTKPQEDRSSR